MARSKELKCPYCGAYNIEEYNHEYNNLELIQIDCIKCRKIFGIDISIGKMKIFKIPCKNGEKHKYEPIEGSTINHQCAYCKQTILKIKS